MSKKIKALAALALALMLVAGLFITALCPSSTVGTAAQAEEMLLARSKKKKNTATPIPTAVPTPAASRATPVPEGPITDPQSIADYLFAHGCLPDNFITKKEAQALGWDNSVNYLSDVAPGKSLGGSYFGNYEELLPVVPGRKYYECDCYYTKGKRNAYRVIFSSDGHVWYTEDHYQTFTELEPTVPEERQYLEFTVY